MRQPFPDTAARALRGLVAPAVRDRLAVALEWGQRRVRPAHGVIAVCVAAAVALAGSQLLDYRAVSIGGPAYSDVQPVAAAPEVDHRRAGTAHGWAMLPIAAVALALTAIAAAGRWRVARLLAPLGVAVVAISLAVDAPKGLDEGGAAVAYEGAEAILLGGFWAQLFAGAALACCGPLLALQLRPRADRGARRGRSRKGRAA